ncbi:MAG TPA: tetratricopeptide repeat protein [Candidatus Angelobacter sp.]|nr:tetratricopeptide repeat protein [Candidatus Angelobacter sp.]
MCVRYRSYFLVFIILISFSFQAPAQTSGTEQLLLASRLRDRGEYQQAVVLLEPLVRASSRLGAVDTGNAWVLLGSTYQDLGRYVEAENAYQNAISILKSQPAGERDLAVALDNLGSLYHDIGRPEMSRKLRLRALTIFRAEGDHAEIARVYNNLAAIALDNHQYHEAQSYLDLAFAEVKLSPLPNPADEAAMDSNAGWLAFHGQDYPRALGDYETALRLWLQVHGSEHQLTGWGYVLCGRARLALGENRRALEDVQTGIAILERTAGAKGSIYLSARLIYADVLRASGSTQEAKTVRAQTLRSLDSLRRSQSSVYVINAEAFR